MTGGSPRKSLGFLEAMIYGGLVVGALDLVDAFFFYGWIRGASPVRIFQSIAAGLLGRASYQGGAASALLGLLIQFVNAFLIVSIYGLASRAIPALTRHPFVLGALYGCGAHLVMFFVVVPLSRAGTPHSTWPVMINGLIGHALFVGIPSALFARASRRGARGALPLLNDAAQAGGVPAGL
jgi:hypothetical protein